jgi:alpha-tubulin suppressor-like RCC1 family protein
LCWGSNNVGELGRGTTSASEPPAEVAGLTNLIDVSSGQGHSCAVKADGTAYCWGFNRHGRLGDGTTNDSALPVAVAGVTDATRIAAGGQHSCALRATGGVMCWGNNLEGALGDGTSTSSAVPVAVVNSNAASGLDATGELSVFGHSCVVVSEGVACWGYNAHGELATGDFETRTEATFVTDLSGIASVALGAFQSGASTTSGDTWVWGLDWVNMRYRSSPERLAGVDTARGLAFGDQHGCVLEGTGKVRCFGINVDGALGDGSNVDSATPVEVLGLTGALEISAGAKHTCARVREGTVYCWGTNASGQLGQRGTAGSPTPLAVPDL